MCVLSKCKGKQRKGKKMAAKGEVWVDRVLRAFPLVSNAKKLAGLHEQLLKYFLKDDLKQPGDKPDDSWRRVKIEPDGNCLFTAAAAGFHATKPNGNVPKAEALAALGERNRKEQMVWMKANLNQPFPEKDSPKLGDSIEASSCLPPAEYFIKMQSWSATDHSTWGGFIEAVVILRFAWRTLSILFGSSSGTASE